MTCLLLASACNKFTSVQDPATDGRAVYEDMWKAMDRNYSLFSLKGISWDSIREADLAKKPESLDNNQLFEIISESLMSLRDGHVTLISPGDTSTYEGFYTNHPANFNFRNIQEYYLHHEYLASGPLIYKIQNGIGYIYIGSFRETITEGDIDKMMSDLSSTRGLIMDVRDNTGGELGNVNRLFARFINQVTLVKYERYKEGPGHDDLAERQPVYISPAGQYYPHPVVVLTNRKCFSACNDFVLYMSGLSRVTLVGDQTGGGGAIPADYLLLNGWKLQYSASMTESPEGLDVESGIVPDFKVDINAIDDANGRDPILEKGIELIQ